MSLNCDLIVIGSGASAVHSIYSSVKAGYSVIMLDVGYEDSRYGPLIPDLPFTTIRKSDQLQHRYFLGDNFEGISFDSVGTGPQLTPPRQYVTKHTDVLMPSVSSSFEHVESLAMGGLASAWGAVCYPFNDYELKKCNLPPKDMHVHYNTIAKRIGISGSANQLSSFLGNLEGIQPPLKLDSNAKLIFSRYLEKKDLFDKENIYLGRPYMAVLTEECKGRRAQPYYDMDFWSNAGGSVYRPDLTVRELQQFKNFKYLRPYLVNKFREDQNDFIKIYAKSLKIGSQETFEARKLILSAGSFGTTRIVLRSLNKYNIPVNILCNRHSYIPCIHYRGFGIRRDERCHSLAQLVMLYDSTGDGRHLVQSQLYSYNSLFLFNLLKESPFPYKESLRIIRTIYPHLIIFTLQHEDNMENGKYCILRKESNCEDDYLEIFYNPSKKSLQSQKSNEKVVMRNIRKLGCFPIKAVHPGHGSSIHYAGQFPMTQEDLPLTTDMNGLLRGTKNVYISDSSMLPYLPAKGLTFTLMANADRVGNIVLQQLQ